MFTVKPTPLQQNRNSFAPLAQLDRARPSGGRGQRFESSRARQWFWIVIPKHCLLNWFAATVIPPSVSLLAAAIRRLLRPRFSIRANRLKAT